MAFIFLTSCEVLTFLVSCDAIKVISDLDFIFFIFRGLIDVELLFPQCLYFLPHCPTYTSCLVPQPCSLSALPKFCLLMTYMSVLYVWCHTAPIFLSSPCGSVQQMFPQCGQENSLRSEWAAHFCQDSSHLELQCSWMLLLLSVHLWFVVHISSPCRSYWVFLSLFTLSFWYTWLVPPENKSTYDPLQELLIGWAH